MLFIQFGNSHHKNEESFQRCCKLFSIEYKKIYSLKEITSTPTLLWSPGEWIDPSLFPKTHFLYGPQFFVFPNSDHPIFHTNPQSNQLCYYNCLSDWNIKIHTEFSNPNTIPYCCLPFGIDTQSLIPSKESKDIDCILYFKNRKRELLFFICSILQQKGIRFDVIHYGTYNHSDFIHKLKKSKFSVWLGCHESQGFAFQESLALNVPMLLCDVTDMKEETNNGTQRSEYERYTIDLPSSAASSWHTSFGMKITDLSLFSESIDKMLQNYSSFQPRKYIENELSDIACFNRLLNLYNIKIN